MARECLSNANRERGHKTNQSTAELKQGKTKQNIRKQLKLNVVKEVLAKTNVSSIFMTVLIRECRLRCYVDLREDEEEEIDAKKKKKMIVFLRRCS